MKNDRLKAAYDFYNAGDPATPEDQAFSKCLNLLNQCIEDGEQLEKAYNLRWHIHYLRKQPELALSDMNSAIALNPENKTFRYNRGVVLQHMGKLKEALADFEIIIDPAFADEEDDLFDAAEHHVIEIKNKLSNHPS